MGDVRPPQRARRRTPRTPIKPPENTAVSTGVVSIPAGITPPEDMLLRDRVHAVENTVASLVEKVDGMAKDVTRVANTNTVLKSFRDEYQADKKEDKARKDHLRDMVIYIVQGVSTTALAMLGVVATIYVSNAVSKSGPQATFTSGIGITLVMIVFLALQSRLPRKPSS